MQYSQLHSLNNHLILRFKDRLDYIKTIKPHIVDINYQNFNILKSQIIEFMSDVEDDLRQSSQTLKTMQAKEIELIDSLNDANIEIGNLKKNSNKGDKSMLDDY